MKNFKALKTASLLVATSLAAGAASAQVNFDMPNKLPMPSSTQTRAEVTADLLVWRASGLHDLNRRGETPADTNTLQHAQATARYNFMRASPQFAVLVDQVSRGGSTGVLLVSR